MLLQKPWNWVPTIWYCFQKLVTEGYFRNNLISSKIDLMLQTQWQKLGMPHMPKTQTGHHNRFSNFKWIHYIWLFTLSHIYLPFSQFIRVHILIYVCMHACMHAYIIYVCMYVCMYVCTYVRRYVCMHVCMHVCMSYVCNYVCMYVCKRNVT